MSGPTLPPQPWPDDLPDIPGAAALVTALNAPARPDELAAENAVLDLFRSSLVARRVQPQRRLRLRMAATASALAALCLGGVGAAYASALPSAVQHVAHVILGPIGVPDSSNQNGSPVMASGPEAGRTRPSHTRPPSGSPSRQQIPGAQPARTPSGGGPSSSASTDVGPWGASAGEAGGTSLTGPKAPGTPAAAGTPRNPATGPGSVTASSTPVSSPELTVTLTSPATVVRSGGVVYLTGQLGGPGAGSGAFPLLRAYARSAIQPAWVVVGTAQPNSSGSATFAVGPLNVTTAFVLGDPQGTESNVVIVTVRDHLALRTYRPPAHPLEETLRANAPEASPGDTVFLQRREHGRWVDIATKPLDGRNRTDFVLPISGLTRETEFRAVLAATDLHTSSVSAPVTVDPPASLSPGIAP